MRYPLSLNEQIKFLLENEEFFKTFGKYTEPYPDKFVKWVASEYKDKPFDIYKEFYKLPPAEKSSNYYYTVKFIEDNMVSGGCMTGSLFACAVFRTMGYPAAILVGIDPSVVFDNVNSFKEPILSMHAVCLVKINGLWNLYDITRGTSTKLLSLGLISIGYLPGLIIRDLEDIGVTNKKQMFGLLMYNLRNVLLLDLQEEFLFTRHSKYYKEIKKSLEKLQK